MEKISMNVSRASNRFCPQALYLYGTYKEDGTPNFGLFCWFSYSWNKELRVMCCIGGEKLTKDRIHAGHVFSANLVNQPLLPVADYLGNTEGYTPGKMDIPLSIGKGKVLDVPVLDDSPWSYELEVESMLKQEDGEIYICKIRNVQAAAVLMDESLSLDERMARISPIVTYGHERYYPVTPKALGAWEDWKDYKG